LADWFTVGSIPPLGTAGGKRFLAGTAREQFRLQPRLFRPEVGPCDPLRVDQVVESYLRHAQAEMSASYANREYVLRLFVRDFGTRLVTECRAFHLQQWIEGKKSLRSNWTRRRWASSVRAAFTWAAKLGMIEANPFTGVTFAKGERGYPVEPEQFQTMLRMSTALFRRVLIFLRFTGCRPGEMAKVQWTDIDYKRACIVLAKHKTAKRTGLPRTIVLHPVVVKLLVWIRRRRPHPELVFVNQRGTQWTNTALAWRVRQIREAADIPPDATLYCCRHAFGTQGVLAGVDLMTLAALMGHQSISTTQIYVHLAGKTDHLQAAVGKMFGR
jgi:site-specific recombinase XerD